jgi:2-haloalkanoic acid dehalogenase type II
LIRAVLFDFGGTLVQPVSDEEIPLDRLALKRYPDSVPVLEALKRAGYALAIVSNTTRSGEAQLTLALRNAGIPALFEAIVTSFDVGREKPDPAMFTGALERLGCAPSEAVMVGDDPVKDIHGASSLGIVTIHVRRAPDPLRRDAAPTFLVLSLLEIPALIKDL